MLATAPAAIAGASEVVKMKPGRRSGWHRTDRAGGDVAAHDAEGLGQRAVDDVDAVHDAVALGEPAAARAVHADRVHLVEVGQGAVFLRQVADAPMGAIAPSME